MDKSVYDRFALNSDGGNVAMAKKFLQFFSKGDKEQLSSALSRAIVNGQVDLVDHLVTVYNAPLTDTNVDVVVSAAIAGHIELVKYFIEKRGCRIRYWYACLWWVVNNGDFPLLLYLVKWVQENEPVRFKALLHQMPFTQAISGGHLEIAKYLMEIGTDPFFDDCLALFVASCMGQWRLSKFLVEIGIPPNHKGWKAALLAIQHREWNVMTYILGDTPPRGVISEYGHAKDKVRLRDCLNTHEKKNGVFKWSYSFWLWYLTAWTSGKEQPTSYHLFHDFLYDPHIFMITFSFL